MPSRTTESPLAPIGRLLKLWTVPCAVPLQVWVAAAVPAALTAFWSLFKPVWKQDIKILTGSSWLHHLRNEVQDAETELPTFANNGLKFLFELAEWVDALAWWFFVADMINEFLANWTSNVMKFSNCNPQQDSDTQTGYLPTGGFLPQQGWTVGPEWVLIKHGTSKASGSILDVPAGYYYNLAATAQLQPFLGGLGSYACRIVNTTLGQVLDEDVVNPDQQLDNKTPMVMHINGYNPDVPVRIEFQVMIAPDPGVIEYNAIAGRFSTYVSKTQT